MSIIKTNRETTWMQEQASLANSESKEEKSYLSNQFDEKLENVRASIKAATGVDVISDWDTISKKQAANIMVEYKKEFLQPFIDEYMNYPAETQAERQHMMECAQALEDQWDAKYASFITESTNTSNYLPLSTLDFPALIKQFISFVGKDLVPVATANSMNIEQRIITKYLVNNSTGEEYETPALFFKKDADGNPVWKKVYNQGKGIRLRENSVLTIAAIQGAAEHKFSLYNWLIDDNGNDYVLPANPRNRLSYDTNIQYVQITDGAGAHKVKLPKGGISFDLQTGGNFINGDIDGTLYIVDETTNKPTGDTLEVHTSLHGRIDYLKGTIQVTSCEEITGIYVNGYISNENNLRTIGFREYPEIRKFLIGDGMRFFMPFTVEDFTEASTNLNFKLYPRLVQEIVTASELFEDEYIVDTLMTEFKMYDGVDSDAFAYESYTHTEECDLDPASRVANFAGDPFKYMTSAINNSIKSVIYELCDRGKLDNMGFVIACNPKAARLLQEFAVWTCQKNTNIGGVTMNHAFGLVTDTDIPIRVVSSNRINAYVEIPAYQPGSVAGDVSRELFYHIIAYPMDKLHISYKHLRFAKHFTNSPESAAYADAMNPGGSAMNIMTTSQYKTIHVQGIQGRVILKNSQDCAPDANAGLVG